MRTRLKAVTVTVAMVTAFAILPTFGAAAAEPLEDGSYDVTIGETTYTVDVLEGAPTVEGADGVEFTFAFDETNRVLDEFDVTVDDVTYDVEVADDGTVTVSEAGDEPAEEPTGDEGTEEDGEDLDEGDDEESGEGDDVETLEEDDDVETLEEGDDDGHGAVVSTVAKCAPNGKEARAAGLPNHGVFVSAAAKGEAVEFEVDGEAHSADLSSQAGADAFCALAEELLAAAEAAPESAAAGEDGDGQDGDGEDGGGRGKGGGHGRAGAPGQLKKSG